MENWKHLICSIMKGKTIVGHSINNDINALKNSIPGFDEREYTFIDVTCL